jgi:hypothetical protein
MIHLLHLLFHLLLFPTSIKNIELLLVIRNIQKKTYTLKKITQGFLCMILLLFGFPKKYNFLFITVMIPFIKIY